MANENERMKKIVSKLSKVGVNITKTKSRMEVFQSLKSLQPLPKTLSHDS
ncbi:Lmo0850 family protein [Rossellomorea vietnamensis]|nr:MULTISPECIES: Lmo0850 family protein [Bacillaceae]